jgi:hypothetical protein
LVHCNEAIILMDPSELRSRLLTFREALERRDPSVCGEARQWLIDQVKRYFELFLMQPDRLDSPEAAHDFAMASNKYLADEGDWDVDVLMQSVGKFRKR